MKTLDERIADLNRAGFVLLVDQNLTPPWMAAKELPTFEARFVCSGNAAWVAHAREKTLIEAVEKSVAECEKLRVEAGGV
jgi:hypothetical protein